MERSDLSRFPALGTLTPNTVTRHMLSLPGSALEGEQWSVTAICGQQPGPALFVCAGVHGCEYPAIETVIRLSNAIDPARLSGTLVLLPVVNLPSFRARTPFVCPVDGLNPNRNFPGRPDGSYTEQLVHALMSEFISHADGFVDLHGGDMVEDLVPFSICRQGSAAVDTTALAMATAFGLPYLLLVDRPVQESSGNMSFVAAAESGVPGFIAEAGRTGLLEEEPVQLLLDGMARLLAHLQMLASPVAPAPPPTVLTAFDWLYSEHAGLFHTRVTVGANVTKGQTVGTIDSLFGECLEEVVSPVDGQVLFLTTSPSVTERGLLMGIGVAGAA